MNRIVSVLGDCCPLSVFPLHVHLIGVYREPSGLLVRHWASVVEASDYLDLVQIYQHSST